MRFPVAVGFLVQSVPGVLSVDVRRQGSATPRHEKSILRRPLNQERKEHVHDPSTSTHSNGYAVNFVSKDVINDSIRSRGRNLVAPQHPIQKPFIDEPIRTGSTVGKQCDPNQIAIADEDIIGILSCGIGEYCVESRGSDLGGYCALKSSHLPSHVLGSSVHDARREKEQLVPDHVLDSDVKQRKNAAIAEYFDPSLYSQYQVFCNSSSPTFAPAKYGINCDCNGFDPVLANGNIVCTPDLTCRTYSNVSICANFTYTFAYSQNDITATVCGSTSDQNVCVVYDYYPIEKCGMYHNGLQCQSCTMTPDAYCVDFDCSNVVRGDLAGSTCDENQPIFTVTDQVFETNEIACMLMLESSKDNLTGLDCGCSTVLDVDGLSPDDPAFSLDCRSQCDLCDQSRQICGSLSSRKLLTQGRDNITLTQVYKYTAGRDAEVVITQDCSADKNLVFKCTNCEVRVDGTPCNSCEIAICGEREIFANVKVDCGNIEEGAVFDPCIDQEFTAGDLFFGPTQGLERCDPPSEFESTINSVDFAVCSDSDAPFLADGPTIFGEVLQTVLNPESNLSSCTSSSFDSLYSGVWLNVVGNGQFLTATTCFPETNFDTVISVYEGPSCDELRCVDGNNDGICVDGEGAFGKLTSSVSWITQEGVIYRVRVHGNNKSFGQFGLSITSDPDVLPPKNVECLRSIPLEVGVVQSGSLGAANESSYNNACSGRSISGIGGWYEVVGNGNIYTVSSCLSGTEVATEISVYTGGCGSLVCETVFHQFPICDNSKIESIAFSVSWLSIVGEVYNVMVTGSNVDDLQGAYQLILTEQPKATNSKCSSADTNLTIGFHPIIGNTISGENATICSDGGEITSTGVWYVVAATTGRGFLTASTCSASETNFLSELSVYRGSCEALECIAGIDTSNTCDGDLLVEVPTRGSIVSWPASIDEMFYIFVHGKALATSNFAGDFLLSLSEVEAPAKGGGCSDAVEVSADGNVVLGSTNGAELTEGLDSNCAHAGTGVWYSVRGTGAVLRASTCHAETEFATFLAVFEGNNRTQDLCTELQCIGSAKNNSVACSTEGMPSASFRWQSERGATYYLHIENTEEIPGVGSGTFGLSVSEIPAVVNDSCDSAVGGLQPDGQSLTGSTMIATNDFAPEITCGVSLNSPGVWYGPVKGADVGFAVSTCLGNYYTAQISVFEGECDALKCVDGSRSHDLVCESDEAAVKWFAEAGKLYFIFVHGSSQEEFTISLTKFEGAERNSFCFQAIELSIDETTSGSTNEAIQGTVAPGDYCGVLIDKPGVWYSLNGTNETLQISGCTTEGVDYEVSVSVFTGSCGDLICLDGQSFSDSCSDPQEFEKRQLQVEQRSLTWFAEAGATYFVLVHGRDPSSGDAGLGSFEIIVKQSPLPVAPDIPNPSPLAVDNGFMSDTDTQPTARPTVDSEGTISSPNRPSEAPTYAEKGGGRPNDKGSEAPIPSEAADLARLAAASALTAGVLSLAIDILYQ